LIVGMGATRRDHFQAELVGCRRSRGKRPLKAKLMPILPAEPDYYPPDLWRNGAIAPADPIDGSTPCWWCLHTKPRQEKATARYLGSQHLAYYLPLYLHESRTPAGRKIRSTLPLFAGYLFLHGNQAARLAALQGNTLVRVLEVSPQDRLDSDLRQIHRLLSSGLSVSPEPTHPVGAAVRISSGPLTGLKGVIVRRERGDRFVAVVEFLNLGAAVQLEDWQVERIDAGSNSDQGQRDA
jgi:transcription antitermination factor NusG